MPTCCTLDQLKRYMGIPLTPSEHDDGLLHALRAATERAEHLTRRHLIPYRAGLLHDVYPVFPRVVFLADDLLQLEGVSDAGGDIDLANVTVEPPTLRLNDERVFLWDSTPKQAVTVHGLWGWHPYPETMWQAVDSLAASVADDSALLPVADSSAFSIGAVLRVGDELMSVAAIHADTHTLTVARAINGTIATSYAQSTPIDAYTPPPMLADAVLALAAFYVHRADQPDLQPSADLFDTLRQMARQTVRT